MRPGHPLIARRRVQRRRIHRVIAGIDRSVRADRAHGRTSGARVGCRRHAPCAGCGRADGQGRGDGGV